MIFLLYAILLLNPSFTRISYSSRKSFQQAVQIIVRKQAESMPGSWNGRAWVAPKGMRSRRLRNGSRTWQRIHRQDQRLAG